MVRIVELEPPRPRGLARISGEELRRLFELRLDARDRELAAWSRRRALAGGVRGRVSALRVGGRGRSGMSGPARRDRAPRRAAASAVPDVLGPDLEVVFCGINPGRVSAAAAAHFANPRNDFWRLLADAGFTERLYGPEEQFALLELGLGLTNAALRTTPGSGDLRSADFAGSAERLERIAFELRPHAIAFVGKEAYRGTFRDRPELGPQQRTLDDVGLFVLPSTSPANAAVPYAERLRWFRELRRWLEPTPREAARALMLDRDDRTLLVEFRDEQGQT